MRSIIFWIVAVILVAFAIAFSAFNQHHAGIDLWPLDIELSLPLYLIVLCALACGFLLGGIVAIALGGKGRATRREALYRNEMLERENAELRAKSDTDPSQPKGTSLLASR
ncbi:MAG: LapA family protein [Kiloniellales bacterium]|nr:LapA family protein [Kiloniellales bacterium]